MTITNENAGSLPRNGHEKVNLYTVADLMEIFHIGRTNAYKLMNAQGFPSIRINRMLYVRETDLARWLDQRKGSPFYF